MTNIKTEVISENQVSTLRKILLFGAFLFFVPLFHGQWFVGPIVNAILYIACYFLIARDVFVLALLPSLVAFFGGLLPMVAAPFLPYIIVSNWVLIYIFNYLRQRNFWLAVALASFSKYLFLLGASFVLTNYFLTGKSAQIVANMFSWPQLATALAGGFIAYSFLKFFKII